MTQLGFEGGRQDAGQALAETTCRPARRGRPIRQRGALNAEHDIFRYMNISPVAFFAALAQDTRLRCLLLLCQHEELCVCELTYAIGVAQPQVSRHLALLREAGLVADRREGLWIHYRLHPRLPPWAVSVLRETARANAREEPFVGDQAALAAMPNRPGSVRCA